METKNKCFEAQKSENLAVLNYRQNLQLLLSGNGMYNVKVLIGGSYCLRCTLDAFAEREYHDYDFIVIPADVKDRVFVLNTLDTLKKLGICKTSNYYSANGAYTIGTCNGRKADILISNQEYPELFIQRYQKGSAIMDAKISYAQQNLSNCRPIRSKDVKDLLKYYYECDRRYFVHKYDGTKALGKKELQAIINIAKDMPNLPVEVAMAIIIPILFLDK